jgi:stage III sporulation protein AB
MLRFIAAGLIILSGAGLGFAMADVFSKRPRQLRQLQFALTVLGTEIRFRQTPLPGAFAAVAVATPMPVGRLFADLGVALTVADGRGLGWAWEKVKPEPGVALAAEDFGLLENLMQVLGTGSVADQVRQLDLHLEHLRHLEQEAEASRLANEKIWRYLGVLSGIALVLILL